MLMFKKAQEMMPYHNMQGKVGYVYILSNYRRNVIYIGVTNDLIQRVWKHKTGKGAKFSTKYNLKHLVYFEKYPNINEAIAREKKLKNWHREWKMNLIRKENPNLEDLWPKII